jgi:hypothetical protein
MERYLTGLVALLLFGAVAAFLGYIPIVPMIVTVLILTALVLMFLLGLYVGANVDLRLLAQADRIQTDAGATPLNGPQLPRRTALNPQTIRRNWRHKGVDGIQELGLPRTVYGGTATNPRNSGDSVELAVTIARSKTLLILPSTRPSVEKDKRRRITPRRN